MRVLVGLRVEFTPAQSDKGFQAFDAIILIDAEQWTNSARATTHQTSRHRAQQRTS
jgi:hypothetical protein